MLLKEAVEVYLQPYLEEGKYFVVDIVMKPSKVSQKVLILLDSDEGITIQECAEISRRLGDDLEGAEPGGPAYTLEVSSPGLDQPLRLLRQYRKNIGRTLKVVCTGGETLSGTLLEVKGEDQATGSIILQLAPPKKKSRPTTEEAPQPPEISLRDITKAVVQVSFK